LKPTNGFCRFLLWQIGTRDEAFLLNRMPMCHSPGSLQADNPGGGHTSGPKFPASCRVACVVRCVFATSIRRSASSPLGFGCGDTSTRLALRLRVPSAFAGRDKLHCPNGKATLVSEDRKMHRSCHSPSFTLGLQQNVLSARSRDLASRSSSARCCRPGARSGCD
jgi:hypothetical protein